MKNNPNTKYLLIALVLLIWGLIIYRVISSLTGDDPPPVTTKLKPVTLADTLPPYRLTGASYPDPFSNNLFEEEEEKVLAEEPATGNSKSAQQNIAPVSAQPPPVVAPPPAIKYSGYIYNPHTKKKTAIITFNGRSMMVGINEKIDEKLRVVAISEQQLTVAADGRRMVFLLGG